MRKLHHYLMIAFILILGSTLSVLAGSSMETNKRDPKSLDTPISPAQQALIDQELAYKASVLKDYVATAESLNPYFIETAKKLNVDITGLTDDEIMIKVKEAEVQDSIDHPVILTPSQQAELDRLIAQKNAQIAQ